MSYSLLDLHEGFPGIATSEFGSLGFGFSDLYLAEDWRVCVAFTTLVSRGQSLLMAAQSIIPHSLFPLVSLCFSTLSKQRKNVISCVTVHDSPYSDSSSNNSPYAVQHRAGQNNGNTYDTKGVPETHCSGNPRTIIVPPLKTQASEVLVECDSLAPGKLHLFRQEN